MLEVDAGQTDNESPMEGNCQLEEVRESEGETCQRQQLSRKNCKGDLFNIFCLADLVLKDCC